MIGQRKLSESDTFLKKDTTRIDSPCFFLCFQDKNNKLSPKSTVPWHERLTQPKGPKPEDPTAKGPTVLNKAQGSTAADFIVAAWKARSLMISLVKEGG